MRNLIALLHTSLDGCVATTTGALDFLQMDDQVWEFVDQHIHQSDTGVYGPTTFQMMESYWPGVLKDPTAQGHAFRHARWYADAHKVVFSRKLAKLNNPDAQLISHNIVDEVIALKKRPGKKLIVLGSPTLVQSLAQLDLIDEFVISVNPIILGEGTRMFNGTKRIKLNLVSTTQFAHGGVGLHYTK